MPENVENAETETGIELDVQVTKASPMVRAALEFYSMRCGVSIEEYCRSAVLSALQMDEDSGDHTFNPNMI
jgi:hypothetical protein